MKRYELGFIWSHLADVATSKELNINKSVHRRLVVLDLSPNNRMP